MADPLNPCTPFAYAISPTGAWNSEGQAKIDLPSPFLRNGVEVTDRAEIAANLGFGPSGRTGECWVTLFLRDPRPGYPAGVTVETYRVTRPIP